MPVIKFSATDILYYKTVLFILYNYIVYIIKLYCLYYITILFILYNCIVYIIKLYCLADTNDSLFYFVQISCLNVPLIPGTN